MLLAKEFHDFKQSLFENLVIKYTTWYISFENHLVYDCCKVYDIVLLRIKECREKCGIEYILIYYFKIYIIELYLRNVSSNYPRPSWKFKWMLMMKGTSSEISFIQRFRTYSYRDIFLSFSCWSNKPLLMFLCNALLMLGCQKIS